MRELLDLLSDVGEEGVAFPSANKHDGKDGHVVEVHGHGGSAANGVCSDFACSETEKLFTDNRDRCTKLQQDCSR